MQSILVNVDPVERAVWLGPAGQDTGGFNEKKVPVVVPDLFPCKRLLIERCLSGRSAGSSIHT